MDGASGRGGRKGGRHGEPRSSHAPAIVAGSSPYAAVMKVREPGRPTPRRHRRGAAPLGLAGVRRRRPALSRGRRLGRARRRLGVDRGDPRRARVRGRRGMAVLAAGRSGTAARGGRAAGRALPHVRGPARAARRRARARRAARAPADARVFDVRDRRGRLPRLAPAPALGPAAHVAPPGAGAARLADHGGVGGSGARSPTGGRCKRGHATRGRLDHEPADGRTRPRAGAFARSGRGTIAATGRTRARRPDRHRARRARQARGTGASDSRPRVGWHVIVARRRLAHVGWQRAGGAPDLGRAARPALTVGLGEAAGVEP